MNILNEQIDLMLEVSQLLNGDKRNLMVIVEQVSTLKPNEAKSVFLAIPIRGALDQLKKAFEVYIADQSKSPLGARANADVVEKVKRVYAILDATIKELKEKGSERLDNIYNPRQNPTDNNARKDNKESPNNNKFADNKPSREESPDGDKELTPEEQKEVKGYADQASEIFAKEIIRQPEEADKLVDKFGSILKRYFLKKRVSSLGDSRLEEDKTLSEVLLSEDETTTDTNPPKPTTPPGSDPSSSADAAKVLDAFTKEIDIPPKEAKKNLEDVEESLKKAIEDYDELSDEEKLDKDKEIKKYRYLILRAAGEEIENAIRALKENLDYRSGHILNLNELKHQTLNEGLLGMFGAWIEYALKGLFGGWSSPPKVIGTASDLNAFKNVFGGEVKYINSVKKYGLDHPSTYKDRALLDKAVKDFEKETNIKWPFR